MDTLSQGDPFLQLIDRLGRLNTATSAQARPIVAEIRSRLVEAAAARGRGDVSAALAIIGNAMERLAGLVSQADPAQKEMMHAITQSFARVMSAGDRGAVAATGAIAAESKKTDSNR